MKTLIIVLIIVSFLQSTIIPLDLVLIILICRSYIRPDKSNLLLAFAFGLFIGHLNLTSLGFQSFIYLILVFITEALSKSRLAGNSLLIVPLTVFLSSINQIILSIFIHESFHFFPKNLLEAFLSLPILYLVRLWEERFIVRRGIKLRL
ncbi:MAG: hypothetical protein Q7R43_05390 [Candidatus Daviesbacteria bacterium]|nr:hypothetical protein [Candidatus Daviesbacteria bacterium]